MSTRRQQTLCKRSGHRWSRDLLSATLIVDHALGEMASQRRHWRICWRCDVQEDLPLDEGFTMYLDESATGNDF